MAAEGWREKEIFTKGAIKGHLENIEYSKYQLIVVTAEEVFVEAISFLAEKNCLAVSLIGSTCVFFLSEDSASGF